MTTITPIQMQLVSSEHGFDDFDVTGHSEVHRITVGHNIKKGDICNVYGPGSSKRGASYQGTPEGTLAVFISESCTPTPAPEVGVSQA